MLLPGESAGVTATIEWAYSSTAGGSLSAWQAYKPGVYSFVALQWRVTFTRPDTAYQVQATGFGTRLSRIARQRFERSDVERSFDRPVLSL